MFGSPLQQYAEPAKAMDFNLVPNFRPVHNERCALDARTALCLHIERRWPGASDSERSA